MAISRKTAIVQIELPSGALAESLPLTTEREFHVTVTIEKTQYPAGVFRSPINDEQWREFKNRLSECNVNRSEDGYNAAQSIRALGGKLFRTLAGLAPKLHAFLTEAGIARRLVIQTTRSELHLLPWGALYDPEADLLAAGDLSVVQAWDPFRESAAFLSGRLNLVRVLGSDTNKSSISGLKGLPPEISQLPTGRPDILHLEEHGNAALSEIGGVRATKFAQAYGKTSIALLWSCYSGAANSWGQSPALCLHREGAGLVLSFQAELNNLDASSIAQAFYADVFGPAASRDPETALLRIRVEKYTKEFEYSNWASMMLYLRSPLDLSALPLNGERVPKSLWSDSSITLLPDAEWEELAGLIANLQPGSRIGLPARVAIPSHAKLPRSIAAAWHGNVIRLDGHTNPLSDSAIHELNLEPREAPRTDVSDKLTWFFESIARYGAPLIVWTNSAPHHLEFLAAAGADLSLTFLLLYGPARTLSMPELVDQNRLEEAQALAATLPADANDLLLSEAYFAYARCERADEALQYMRRIADKGERWLLSGNYVSRFGPLPEWEEDQQDQQAKNEEDLYRAALNMPGASASLTGRARKELGYLMSCRKQDGIAEAFYEGALQDLERSHERDSRWQFALASTLRDWADLIAKYPLRLDEASNLLRRAAAIHTFHGRTLEVAYCLTTTARIALCAGRHSESVDHALDAANRFEDCNNWRGWSSAIEILLDALGKIRETSRMISIVDLAARKVAASNMKPAKKVEVQRSLLFKLAEAHWIAGDLSLAYRSLGEVFRDAPPSFLTTDLGRRSARLRQFLTPARALLNSEAAQT